jgi:putative addiction module killer protein
MARLKNAIFGNFGNCAPVGEGVSEMKIDVGPGYRVYYTRIGDTTYFLLASGDKSTPMAIREMPHTPNWQ